MNIQIFGTKKCKDTQKAERFFKERKIQFHFRDLTIKGLLSNFLFYYLNELFMFVNNINYNAK